MQYVGSVLYKIKSKSGKRGDILRFVKPIPMICDIIY